MARTAALELHPGDRVGPYRLVAPLGEGGMGIVFRADRSTGGVAALKVLRRELSGDETFRRRFEREGRIAAQLDHPHLVEVVDAGEADGRHYLASRFVDGETLAARLTRDGPLPSSDLLRLAAELATGLDALHEAGLVHRDIKPSNVMLGADGAALTDFGLARGEADSVLTTPGRVVGTLDYLAPEVIRGQPAGPPADIYALGCLLYECVCGAPPFGSRPFAEAAAAHLTEEPLDPSGARDDLPPAFWQALRHGLAKDPDERPPTATAYALMIRVSAKTG
ncbi:MAG: serine/threonine protein kinase [Actinomycetota bacterium]|nr:serine/threonine protein kinase [Actinomycetota bacterium]